jgi:Fe2+ transport system protein FeoA
MALTWWKFRNSGAAGRNSACPLTQCSAGCRAAVLRMECPDMEASRLRNLGLYEGSCVTVVERQGSLVLEVAGSRLALGPKVAKEITVLPLDK